jgi:prepilin-type N-terminal cleavage/methylation domain-containing protein
VILPRRGFTLLEMAITLAVLSIAAALVAPALVDFGKQQTRSTGSELLHLLASARRTAIDSNVSVMVTVDPEDGRYRVDSLGPFGRGPVAEGELDLAGFERLETDASRLTWRIESTGLAFGDTVLVRGMDHALLIGLDPWNGIAWTDAR